MKINRRFSSVFTPLALALPLFAIGCSDPPPPSLARVDIDRVSNEASANVTYEWKTDTSGNQQEVGLADKGIILGDGLSVAVDFSRLIADPPKDSNEKKNLFEKPFKVTVRGDVFTAQAQVKEYQRIVLTSTKPGKGELELTVEGLTGSAIVPITIVEQDNVPATVHPPRPDKPATTTDAGTGPTSDAGAGDAG